MNGVADREQVYRQYHQKVGSYIRGKVQNVHDVEDLTADVFVKIFEKFDDFDEEKAALSTWIYTITRNTVIDYYRKQKDFSPLDEALPVDDNTVGFLLREEMLEVLANELARLDVRSRKIVILRYFQGRTLRDIAKQMEISYSYVKVLHNQALADLRQRLAL